MLLSGKFEHLDELVNVSLKAPENMGEVGPKSLKYQNYLTPAKPVRDQAGRAGQAGQAGQTGSAEAESEE